MEDIEKLKQFITDKRNYYEGKNKDFEWSNETRIQNQIVINTCEEILKEISNIELKVGQYAE